MDRLTFEKPDDVGKWLEDKPPDWAQVVAVRVALRVFPLVLSSVTLSDEILSEQQKQRLVLATFRAAFITWVSRKFPDRRILLDEASEAVNSAAFACDKSVADSAIASAYAIAYAAADSGYKDAIVLTISNAANAVTAVDTTNTVAFKSLVLSSTSMDCQRLLDGRKPDELIRQPLWLEDVRGSDHFQANFPVWARLTFDTYVNSKMGGTIGGKLIAEWYRGIIPNYRYAKPESAFGEEADIAIATQPDGFWTVSNDRSVEDVWADIDRIRKGEPITPVEGTKNVDEGLLSFLVDDGEDGPSEANEAVPDQEDEQEAGRYGTGDFSEGPYGVAKKKEQAPAKINVAVQFDQYARKDELGRKRFAEILATRISELHEGGGPDGLAVNLHAPWGAGKTTVLHFMKGYLEAEDLPAEKRWVVIDFNAWQHEHRRPPWWPFLKALKSQLSDRLTTQQRYTRAGEVRHTWRAWQLRAEAPPYLAGLLVVSLVLTLIWSGSSDIAKSILSGIGGVLAVITAATLYSRKMFFGSTKSATLYHDYASDPLEKLSVLFKDMIEAADSPVCIFIDDLDRCQNDFVVEFLEGLQTSFRHRKVAYVIAADKFWIKTSFEDKYASFCEKTADRTQPLGYQFLEKIFQFNVPLPGMAAWKKRYLVARLGLMGTGSGGTGDWDAESLAPGTGTGSGEGASPDETAEDQEVDRLRDEIRSTQPEGLTHETVRTLSTGDGSHNPAYQAALALEYTASKTARREAEHFLFQYLELLPDNPRVIKRIINAFGMAVATAILESQALDYDVLTRWTILEQCYPAVADELAGDPDLADELLKADAAGGEDLTDLPETLAAFCEKEMAVKLLKNGDNAVLTPKVIRRLTRGFDEEDAEAA